MLKVLVACGCGMGSSQMIKQNCITVLNKLGIECTVHHTSIDEAKSTAHDYDLVVVAENFVGSIKPGKHTTIIGLKSILNKKELKQKLIDAGIAPQPQEP